MEHSQSGDVTQMLRKVESGDKAARDSLLAMVYRELRRLASRMGAHQSDTLNPTALVNEAYLKLAENDFEFKDRVHFYAVVCRAMRQLLIDHSRRKVTQKRGMGKENLPLKEELLGEDDQQQPTMIAQALLVLEKVNVKHCRMIELKYFGGLTNKEIALGMDMSERSVNNHLKVAQTWLAHWLQRNRPG